jgi:hypothetical protein
MIKDELEYRVSQEWVIKFKQSLAAMDNSFESKINDYERWQLNRSALQCHLDKLIQEIAEYERLINCDISQPIKIKVNSLNELPITCDVSDETGYWENRNIEELARIIRQHNVLIAALTGKIKDDLAEEGIVSQSSIFDYPDFEYLEAEGKQLPDFKS